VTFGALVVAQDFGTVGCGLLNAGYFSDHWWNGNGSRSRRTGAAALVLVSGAAVVEAVFSQWLFWAEQGVVSSELSPEGWALVRLPLFVATVLISIIIVRRVVG